MNSNEPAEKVPAETGSSSTTETGTADQVPTETDGSSAIESGNSSPWNSISFSELYLKRYLRLKTLPLNFSCNACPSKINKVASKQCSNLYIFTCKSLLERRQLLFNKNHQKSFELLHFFENKLHKCSFILSTMVNLSLFQEMSI